MNTTAEVFLWGTRIGIVHQEEAVASFEYDREFINSGIELSPIMMPLGKTVYEFPNLIEAPFYGLPGLLSDSLPDAFGNKLINTWLFSRGKTISDFTSIDRLCYTGNRGMGALEYVPAIFENKNNDEIINVSEMIRFVSKILTEREKIKLNVEDEISYSQLLSVGTSAGGARAKALVAWNEKTGEVRSGQIDLGEDFNYWLMKFDNIKNNGDHNLIDTKEYTLIEYAYYKMALMAGINMSECRIFKNGHENHFITKRFDREKGKKIHMQTLGALSHVNYNEPGLCSYEMAVEYMRKLDLSAKEIEQFYRRMVFNVFAVNQDDHVKNISFLMNKKGEWKLSPAYDVTFAYNSKNRWLQAHQMSVNGKCSDISQGDLIMSGVNMGIKESKCKVIIEEVRSAVLEFEKIANGIGIAEHTVEEINEAIRKVLDK